LGLILGGATFPYGEVASLFLCFEEDVVEKDEEGLGGKLISVRLIGGPHEW
jgi:hypothetical protein